MTEGMLKQLLIEFLENKFGCPATMLGEYPQSCKEHLEEWKPSKYDPGDTKCWKEEKDEMSECWEREFADVDGKNIFFYEEGISSDDQLEFLDWVAALVKKLRDETKILEIPK